MKRYGVPAGGLFSLDSVFDAGLLNALPLHVGGQIKPSVPQGLNVVNYKARTRARDAPGSGTRVCGAESSAHGRVTPDAPIHVPFAAEAVIFPMVRSAFVAYLGTPVPMFTETGNGRKQENGNPRHALLSENWGKDFRAGSLKLENVQLTLDFDSDDAETIVRALRNEAARLSIVNRGGSGAADRFADQIEVAVRKTAERETAGKPKEKKALSR